MDETERVPDNPVDECVRVESLVVGSSIAQNFYDKAGVLLLAAGSVITPRFLQLLKRRDIQVVQIVPAAEPASGEVADSEKTEEIDALVARNTNEQLRNRPDKAAKRPRLPVHALFDEATRGLHKLHNTSSMLADISESIVRGHDVSTDSLQETVGDFADLLEVDSDLLATIVNIHESLGEYLFDHSVCASLLSMSLAAELNMSREQIVGVGLGASLQDLGMMRVPESIRLAPRALTPAEWAEIRRHPVYTLDYLERLRKVPDIARIIADQVHERPDGTGYPRQKSGHEIDLYARIVAVANAFAAMCRNRPHRRRMIAYDAMKEVLVESSRDRFDRGSVRGFLDCMSIFPIGSLVELNDGRTAKVIRANRGAHTAPVVLLTEDDGALSDEFVVDLSQEPGLKVLRAR